MSPVVDQIWEAPHGKHGQALAHLWQTGQITIDELSEVIWPAWRNQIDFTTDPAYEVWQEMFRAVGYQHDGQIARRPLLSRRLYRGAPADKALGMSWTTNPGVARHFLTRHYGTPAVWTTVAAPWRFLASGSDEREYVLNTEGLTIEPYEVSKIKPGWVKHPALPHRWRGN